MNTHYVPLRRYGKFLLLSTWLFFLWPDTYAQNPLRLLGQGVAMDAEGRKIETMANFSGGISVNCAPYQTTVTQNLSDPVNVTGDITVDPADEDKTADIFVYAEATFPPDTKLYYYMLGRDQKGNLMIPEWDKEAAKLAAFIPSLRLGIKTDEQPVPGHVQVPMYSGQFIYPGTLKVYFGYRLEEGGTIVFNETPIDIGIEPKIVVTSPKISEITATGPKTVHLKWATTQTDLEYQIYVSTEPSVDICNDTPHTTVNDTPHTTVVDHNQYQYQYQSDLTNLDPDTTYYVWVVARDTQGNRSMSENYQVVKTLVPRYYSTPTPEQTYFLGSENVGKTVFQNLTIMEIGNADLQVTFDSLTGTHADAFKVTPANFAFTIADGGASEVVQIQCTPTFVGEHTARLIIETNDPDQPEVGYTLQCNGVPPPKPKYVSIPAPNGTLKFNESASIQQIIVTENGNATLEVKSPVFTGPNASAFKILAPKFPLEIADSGAPQTVTIQCSLQGAESRQNWLIFSSNDPEQPIISYPLTYQGNKPGYGSNPPPNSSVNFGSSTIGESLSKEITIEETGNADLVVNLIGIVGSEASDFKVVSPTFPLTIADGGVATKVTVQCTPQKEGARTAQLQFGTNDPKLPTVSYFLACEGTTLPPLQLTVTPPSNGKVTSTPAGIECGADCTENYVSGTQVTLTATANANATFKEWTGDCTGTTPSVNVTMDVAKTCTATFEPVTPPPALTVMVQGDGKVTSTPAGIDCGTDCTDDYVFGTQVALTATANANATFKEWSGACTGTIPSVSVTMDVAKTCTATFEPVTPPPALTVLVQGDGKVTSTPAGIECGTDCTDNYIFGTQVTLTATANANATFKEWTGDCTGTTPSVSVTMEAVKTCTATFKPITPPPPTLTVTLQGDGKVTSTPAGIDCGSDCTDDYVFGTQVTLTATANANATFKEWSGDCAGTTPSISITMEVAKTCTATFEPVTPPPALTVMVQGDGKVTSTPAGIDCGTDCTEDYASGTPVTLTATANTDATFKEWSGDCAGTTPSISITMEVAKTCTATFEANVVKYPLTLTLTLQGDGKVTSTPTGIDCGSDCTEDYTSGTPVTLTATANANANATFKEWTGDCTGTTPSVSVTMEVVKTCTATFDELTPTYPLTIIVVGSGQVVSTSAGIDCGADCTEEYAFGTQVTLGATANAGANTGFKEWSGDCTGVDPYVTITMDAARSCTATFEDCEGEAVCVPAPILTECQMKLVDDVLGNPSASETTSGGQDTCP